MENPVPKQASPKHLEQTRQSIKIAPAGSLSPIANASGKNPFVRQSQANPLEDRESQMRASGLKSPYQVVRSDDPREQMRIKSLQLLCFKLA